MTHKPLDGPVRVRFAPSPTGYLHVGGTRTALFNWLFARQHGGVFVLRIEDTDRTRSFEDAFAQILDSLYWLGLSWDEGPLVGGPYGPYVQSERAETYRRYAGMLIEAGKAYRCYCTPEELEEERRAARAEGGGGYGGRCRNLSTEEVARFEREGRPSTVRFQIPPGRTVLHDLVHGEIPFENVNLDDFIILKSDGLPTYNFAAVVDDALMEITHVIRGDDHISNTPRQILLFQALGFATPRFAHLPMILGSDGTRLSKRHGAVSTAEYREREGILPQALVNHLALLGWSLDGKTEKFTLGELVRSFSLERVSKKAAVFDPEKLEWLNSLHLKDLSARTRAVLARPFLARAGHPVPGKDLRRLEQIVALHGDRLKSLADVTELSSYFFPGRIEYDGEMARELLGREGMPEMLDALAGRLQDLPTFDGEAIERVVRGLTGERGVKAAALIHPVRFVLTGRTTTPGLFEVMALLGREVVLERLRRGRELALSLHRS